MLAFKSFSQTRGLTTTSASLAAAVTRKSFNKKSSYDKSKNKKGSGNDKSFQNSLLSKNYKKAAGKFDKLLIKQLLTFEPKNKDLIHNSIVQYPRTSIAKLHIAGSFKQHQYNELYSQPVTLFRSREDSKLLEIIAKNESSLSNRYIVNGASGIGKSTILAHFQSFALSKNKKGNKKFENNSILFPISNAESLVDGSNDYKLNPETKKYDQPMYTKEFLKKFRNLNEYALSQIPLSKEITPITSTYKTSVHKIQGTLLDFVNYVLKASATEANTTFAFTTILDELSMQEKLPVYMTIDNFSAFIQHGMTKYRDVENRRIYFQNFTVADSLLKFVSGEKVFKNGAVMVATHGNHRLHNNVTFDIITGDKLIEDYAYEKFRNLDYQLANRLLQNNGLNKFEISEFSLEECESLGKHLFKFDLIHNEYDLENQLLTKSEDEVFDKIAAQKYILSGNGNPKLLMDSCILQYV